MLAHQPDVGPPGDDSRLQPSKPPQVKLQAKYACQPSDGQLSLQPTLSSPTSQACQDTPTSNNYMPTQPRACNTSLPVNQSQSPLQKAGSYRFYCSIIFCFCSVVF